MLEPLLRSLGLAPPLLSPGRFAIPSLSSGIARVDYPLGILDTMTVNSVHVPVVLMRFNDILDAQTLQASLERLLQIGDWRKLAGRAVRDQSGKIVLRVPERHWELADYKGIDFSSVEYSVGIDEHPLGAQLPKVPSPQRTLEGEVLTLQPGVNTFRTFCAPEDRASGLEEMIIAQQPMVSLRVSVFTDATLVAVSWSHAVMDGLAFQAMLEAWCLVMAGREAEVRSIDSPFQDVAVRLWDEDVREKECGEWRREAVGGDEDCIWVDKMLTGWGFFRFALGFVWTVFLKESQVGNRTLVLPKKVMEKLREEAKVGLPEDVEFVSDGDVICAWFTKLLVEAHGWTGPVTQLNVVDLRSRIPGVLNADGVYLQNLTHSAFTFLENGDIAGAPLTTNAQRGRSLGWIAAKIRRAVAKQITPSQVLALWKFAWPTVRDAGRPPVFGDGDSKLTIVSNWVKAKFILDTDFSPAVVRAGKNEENRKNPSGRMVYEITGQVVQQPMVRDTAVIVGKDCEGNYWLAIYLAEKIFSKMEELVQREGGRLS